MSLAGGWGFFLFDMLPPRHSQGIVSGLECWSDGVPEPTSVAGEPWAPEEGSEALFLWGLTDSSPSGPALSLAGMSDIRQTVVIGPGDNAMPTGGSDLLDITLYIIAGGAMAVVGVAVVIGVIQALRQRSEERRIRKHLGR